MAAERISRLPAITVLFTTAGKQYPGARIKYLNPRALVQSVNMGT